MKQGVFRQHSILFQNTLRIFDCLVAILSGLIAYFIQFDSFFPTHAYAIALLLGTIVVFAVSSFSSLYFSMRTRGLGKMAFQVLIAWLAMLVVLPLLAFAFKLGAHFSRLWLFYWVCIGFCSMFLVRALLYELLRFLRTRGINIRRVLIIGDKEPVERLLGEMNSLKWTGYRVQAVSVPDQDSESDLIKPYYTKAVTDWSAYIKSNSIDDVWIAVSFKDGARLEQIMVSLSDETVNIKMVLDFYGVHMLNSSICSIGRFPALEVRHSPMTGSARWLKWVEDKFLSLIIIVMISPVLLLVALLIKFTMPGPIFYRQKRISWNNKEFDMLKFRSMPVDTEQKSGAVWAKPGESRATPLGKVLRSTSLDELPQFINVLKGDMSIVGPRPERPVFVNQFKDEIPGYMQKHMVKAGITGWAQVNGLRGDTDLKKRIEFDLYYIDNWSVWLDLKIIVLTIFKGFINKNAY